MFKKSIFTLVCVLGIIFALNANVLATSQNEINQLYLQKQKETDVKENYDELIDLYNETMSTHAYKALNNVLEVQTHEGNAYDAAFVAAYLHWIFKDAGDRSTAEYYRNALRQIYQMSGNDELPGFIEEVHQYYVNNRPDELK